MTTAWVGANVDPTAGVVLMPAVVQCPRCGFEKHGGVSARPGLCSPCSRPMTPAERAAWR